MADFDELLQEAGTFGRAQKRIFGLLCLLSLTFPGAYMSIVFQGFTPPHWCRDPGAERKRQECGWSPEEARALTTPPGHRSSCERFERDWNTSGCELDRNWSRIAACEHGWEFEDDDRSTMVTEFQLVCSEAWLLDLCQSCLALGFLLSSFTFGFFSDRFGRKASFLVSIVLVSVFGLAVAVAPSYPAILVFRTVFGFGAKNGWMAPFVLITEIVGVDFRRTVGILYQLVFSLGALILPLLAYLIPSWRWLQAALSAPYALFLCYYWWIPESPRWLASRRRLAEAQQVTEDLARENGRKLTKTLEVGPVEELKLSPLDLVRTPTMRRNTLILMFCWFTCSVVYQGLIMRVSIAGGNLYVDFLVGGLVEFPAAFFILLTIERVGRRLPFAASHLLAGAACFATAFMPERLSWLRTVAACLGRLGITTAFEMLVFVNAELYPTVIRNLGVSFCSTMADVGGMVAPFLLFRLAALWLELPLLVFGGLSLVAGGLVLLLPETQGVPLPETISDMERPRGKKPPQNQEQSLMAPSSVGTGHDGLPT